MHALPIIVVTITIHKVFAYLMAEFFFTSRRTAVTGRANANDNMMTTTAGANSPIANVSSGEAIPEGAGVGVAETDPEGVEVLLTVVTVVVGALKFSKVDDGPIVFVFEKLHVTPTLGGIVTSSKTGGLTQRLFSGNLSHSRWAGHDRKLASYTPMHPVRT